MCSSADSLIAPVFVQLQLRDGYDGELIYPTRAFENNKSA